MTDLPIFAQVLLVDAEYPLVDLVTPPLLFIVTQSLLVRRICIVQRGSVTPTASQRTHLSD
jgi:hypothetical protein